MRSICWLAGLTATLTLFSACGSDGSGVNPPPVANFTQQCTNLVCTFDDTSTDDGGITTWSWNFGDPNSGANNLANVENPSHDFSAAGTYQVSLTVTDADGGSNTKVNDVTVTAGTPANVPPTASFTVPTCSAGTPCAFHSTSTDADGTITLTHWEFSDGGTADGVDVTHMYTAAGTFNVTLTVTDDDGALSAPVTQPITISPPAAQDCTLEGTRFLNCFLDITQRASLTVTLTDENCELGGNEFHIRAPLSARQVIFFNGCNVDDGTQYVVDDAAGAPIVFEAGTQVQTQFRQGTPDPTDPPVTFPVGTVEGSFPEWTIRIDDGGAAHLPRNDDLVLTITATPR
jgi:PKD repeat protein